MKAKVYISPWHHSILPWRLSNLHPINIKTVFRKLLRIYNSKHIIFFLNNVSMHANVCVEYMLMCVCVERGGCPIPIYYAHVFVFQTKCKHLGQG